MESPDPAQIAALIAAVDDASLERQVTERGVDAVLTYVFQEMARRFLPHLAEGRAAVIQYDLWLRDGSVRNWQLTVAQGSCGVAPGTDGVPQVTVEMALPKFLRLVSGTLDPATAFMSGDLKVRGDLILAQHMQGWFDHSLQPPVD